MAEVYKARAVEGPRKGQLVALKRLTPKLTTDPEAVDLFCGEADVSAMLKHPHIVEVFEAGVVGEVYYLAMEYVDGRDLALILARCRERKIFLPVNFAVHIGLAALDALGYAHVAKGPTGIPLNIVHCTCRRRTFSSRGSGRSSWAISASPKCARSEGMKRAGRC